MSVDAIFRLAEAAGIAVDWTDANGVGQHVSREALGAILEALDLPCASDAQCKDSIERLAREEARTSLPPLLTAETGRPLRLPRSCGFHGQRYRIEFEAGGHIEGQFPVDRTMRLELPPIAVYGYHRLIVGDAGITLAMAPPRCFGVGDAVPDNPGTRARCWGLAVQLYALRRAGDFGIGDFTALTTLARESGHRCATALAISPVHAMFSADRTRFSPYGPSSRLFLNALHIDPAMVLGENALAKAIADAAPDTGDLRARLEVADLIDWPVAAELKLDVLRRLYEQFKETGTEHQAFQEFRARGGQALADHASFEALHQHIGGDWHSWPVAYRDPRSVAVDAFAMEHADQVSFHAFLQWQASRGMAQAQSAARKAGMPIGLISDLAVGADTAGSQAWSRQQDMINGLSIGAPPDLLNAHGQSWGLGAFDPRAMKLNGFRAYIEMLRAAFANAGGVRIDHVLGLARMWLVPAGASPKEGAYLRYPLDDLLRLIALESWRHRAIVIGEDLGTVPEGFGERLARAGVLGIRVLWFQRDKAHFLAPAAWSADAIATTTTHDLPTFAGWWEGRDIGWRTRLDLLEEDATEMGERDAREQDRAMLWKAFADAGCARGAAPPADTEHAPADEAIAFLAATPAPLAILPIEDALGLPEQWNIPGTTDSHPNWRRRLRQPVEDLLEDSAVAARLAILDGARQSTGGQQ
ncbi:MAG: 4-alpha-glucanotransferase [Burkholderiales bacterium]